MVTFAVFLCPTGFRVFLAALCIRPFHWGFALIQGCLFRFAEMLPGSFHQRGINDLTAMGNETVLLQLPLDGIKQRISTTRSTDPFTEHPQDVGIRDAAGMPQLAETLE